MPIPESAHKLPDGRVRVVFEQRLPPYAAGEDAGFEARYAEELVDRRIARYAKPSEVVPKHAGIAPPESLNKYVHVRVLSGFNNRYSRGDEPTITLAEYDQAHKRGLVEKIADVDMAAVLKRREENERAKAEEWAQAVERRAALAAPPANKAMQGAQAARK